MAPRKKKTENAKILRYPDSAMQAAIAAVREGRFKIREAGRHFGVPHSTLINKVKGRVPEVRKMGRDTYFTQMEEQLLVKHIIACAKKGIPIKRNTLLETVKKILDDDKRLTPFKNNRPGKKWVSLFFKRHPEIAEKQAEGISTARANVSEKDLKSWHQSLKQFLIDENASDILEDPERIFNADESGFQTCPDSGKVLGPVGMKNFYEIKSGREKEQLTVMVTINAAGQVVTPMIVYPLVRISKEIANNVPENWGIGKSPKGWMTGPLYYEYIANILDPWIKANRIKKPVLLLIDGHRSHLTLQVSQYCAENNILAYALFPNSTHISQPADVSVFKCLKSGWRNIVCEYKEKSGNRQITRAGFAPLLSSVFRDKLTPDVVVNGFKRCGIYPFDVTAMDFTRCIDSATRKVAPTSVLPCKIGVETLLLFESFMRQGRKEQFRSCNELWEGEDTATELFYVWKKFRQHCLSDTSPSSAVNATSLRIGVPEESISSTRCNTPAFIAPDLPEKSETSTRCSTPISLPHFFPEITETTARSYTPELKAPNLPEQSQTPTKSGTRVMPQSPENLIECPSLKTPAAEKQHSNFTSNLRIAEKQKQLSPAFANNIIWPSDSPIKKTKKERLPFATTSKKWQDYWLTKENEKEEKTRKIESRKRLREQNKVIQKNKTIRRAINAKARKDTNKRKKRIRIIRSDSDTTSDEDVEQRIEKVVISDTEIEMVKEEEEQPTNLNSIKIGDFVIFIYGDAYFVGRIDSISDEGVLINSMHQSLKNWKWPEREDLILYRISDIKEKIKEPELIHQKRGLYHVPEYEKYCDYI